MCENCIYYNKDFKECMCLKKTSEDVENCLFYHKESERELDNKN